MPPALRRSLDLIRRLMPPEQPWWLIGSAALFLSGVRVTVRDVDVYGPSEVIEAARIALGVPVSAPRADDRFRSRPYFQYRPPGGLEIDFMGGLQVFSAGDWCELQIESDAWIEGVRVPSIPDQLAILQLFARKKDLERAAVLRCLNKALY
ncbi:hypothetical protein [Asticcacaulis excentricus]|uniref:Uncharacterized protein n=1 Tax=Asticcacaulis excentricus TaxID=78587 RepID=A0A3G9G8L9_9CAUL|nr:hypothetical protein [Asticcacaulis excentricus]BBF82271.1 hypothetical protein EM6_2903 [Asticcacaulis excentricus]